MDEDDQTTYCRECGVCHYVRHGHKCETLEPLEDGRRLFDSVGKDMLSQMILSALVKADQALTHGKYVDSARAAARRVVRMLELTSREHLWFKTLTSGDCPEVPWEETE